MTEIDNPQAMKSIKDYLHLYLGCEVMCDGQSRPRKLKTIHHDSVVEVEYNGIGGEEMYPHEVRPILRPLSDMTDEECEQYNAIMNTVYNAVNMMQNQILTEAATTKFLLNKGFDLFRLIESGLAIDKTKSSL